MSKIKRISFLCLIFMFINVNSFGYNYMPNYKESLEEIKKYGCVIGNESYRPVMKEKDEKKEQVEEQSTSCQQDFNNSNSYSNSNSSNKSYEEQKLDEERARREQLEKEKRELEERKNKEESRVTQITATKIEKMKKYKELEKLLKELDCLDKQNEELLKVDNYKNQDIYYKEKYENAVMKSISKNKSDIHNLKIKMADLKTEIENLQNLIPEETKKLSDTTVELANVYSNLESRGDPVDISTGRFIANYTDYNSQDFLDVFKVKRNYSYGNYKESFGNNWICSLDSRIIRYNINNYDEYIKKFEEYLQESKDVQKLYTDFKIKYGSTSEILDENYQEAVEAENEIESILNELYSLNKIYEDLENKNKYVKYGKYSNEDEYSGFDNLLLYITEDGVKLGFFYTGDGQWVPVSVLPLGNLIIKNLDINGNYSENENCDGGYELIFENKNRKLFSPYGILEKNVDKNQNETIYKSENGRIYQVILKTGEVINIERNSKNYITAIKGDISGSAYYFYTGDNLTKVIGNNKIGIAYSYNDNGDLISIIKNNDSEIKIDYEYNSVLKHNVCVAVTNSNNDKEDFYLDANNRIMEHNYYGGGTEIAKFDELGRTIYFSDLHGNIMETEYNYFGEITAVTKNGNRKVYEYDEDGHPVAITYEDGKKDFTFYNDLGLITKITDREGGSNSFEYDKNGNLIKSFMGNTLCGTYWYYPNGLLQGYTENGSVVEFKYNKYGSVIEKSMRMADGRKVIYKWTYDEKNKLISSEDPSGDITYCEYYDNKEIITKGNYRITNIFNERNLIIKEIEEDLYTGEKHIKENVYDNLDNIIKVYTDEALLSEYEYFENGLLKSYIVWNNPDEKYKKELFYGIKTEYKYDKKWFKIAEIKSKIKNNIETERINIAEYKYNKNNTNLIVTEKRYMEAGKISTFNKYGKLIKEEWLDGYCKIYNYSKTGKLLSVKDSQDNLYLYKYGTNGCYKIIYENPYGGQILYEFNQYGDLVSIKDYYGLSYMYKYDSLRNLIYEKGPLYSITKKYDSKNRNIFNCLKDKNGKIISEYSIKFDDKTNTKYVISDGYTEAIKKCNVWGMVTEYKGIEGHFYYSYDFMGNCKKITDYYGNETKFEYSPLFDVLVEEFYDGTTKNYEYDLAGFISKISRNDRTDYSCLVEGDYLETKELGGSSRVEVNDEYGCDYSFYDTGKYHKEKINEDSYSITDEYGNSYIYETDKSGNIIQETNPMGYISKLKYSKEGNVTEKVNYSGLVEKYNYNPITNLTTVEYSNGEKVEILRNEIGKISKISTNDYSIEYEFDKRGNLISEYSEKTGSRINYYYDSFSRCVKKSGADFSFLYVYDEMSRLVKLEDEKSGSWIKFEYDNLLRVKNKKYSNGMESFYGYNDYGQLEYSVTKNSLGMLMAGEFILYDKYGRINILADVNGNITKYKYDDRSRLISTEYPYSESKQKAYLDEAVECGYYVMNRKPSTGMLSLNNDESAEIRKLYEKAGVNFYLSLNTNQETWTEKYEYTKNGNIKTVTNPYGQIEYSYDSLNRLVSKNYKSSNENGIKLKWNNDNLLEEIISKKRKISFLYGALKRPEKIITEDFTNGNCEVTEYCYDGLGRRVLERCNNVNIENIYDGVSSVIISKQNITNNNFISSIFSNESSSYNLEQYKQSSEYRFVDNEKYTPFGDFHGSDNGDMNINKYFEKEKDDDNNNLQGCNILSYGGEPVLISYVDGSQLYNSDTEFVLTNYKTQIIGTVNNKSDYTEYTELDTWGNSISGNVKSDNKDNMILNLGYRDYIPMLKTFTTEDPCRDGTNWFAYCACDSVNYFDTLGFAKQSLTESDYLLFQSNIYKFLNFNEFDYRDADKRDDSNCYMGLFGGYDCTDIVMAVSYLAMKAAGLEADMEQAKKFAEDYTDKKFKDSKQAACSFDIYTGELGRKISCGIDSEFFKTNGIYTEKDFLGKVDEINKIYSDAITKSDEAAIKLDEAKLKADNAEKEGEKAKQDISNAEKKLAEVKNRKEKSQKKIEELELEIEEFENKKRKTWKDKKAAENVMKDIETAKKNDETLSNEIEEAEKEVEDAKKDAKDAEIEIEETKKLVETAEKEANATNEEAQKECKIAQKYNDRIDATNNLKNPDIIKPGTVLVWKNSEYNRKECCPQNCGHAVVVLSREFDADGNIVGFVIMEGHTGGEKTELSYIDLKDDSNGVSSYYGELAGIYEMENPNSPKVQSNCVM